ncbi:MAG: TldD/PmbA family protein [Candidatus Helarchaeota archaeon]
MEDLLPSLIEKKIARESVEFIDIRIQHSRGTTIKCIDGQTREITSFIESGGCIRAFVNGSYGFSTTNNLEKESIESAIISAVKLARFGEKHAKIKFHLIDIPAIKTSVTIPTRINLDDISIEEKIKYVLQIDKDSLAVDDRIVNRNTSYSDLKEKVITCNSFGSYIKQENSYLHFNVVNYAADGGVRQKGRESIGHVGGWEIMNTEKALNAGHDAAEKAILLLQARAPKSGVFPTILSPTLGGVFVHEAFGHCCEADSVLNGASILEGKVGESVANDKVTIIDDATKMPLYGSFHFDSEGTPANRQILVEKGILKGYLHSLETASRMNIMQAPGNCRAMGYQSIPIIRMSNTFLEPGNWTFEEMLAEVKNGIFARDWQYGYVDPSKGTFAFKAGESYEIKNGELTTLMRDCTLSGITLETLHDIIGLSKEIEFSPGTCGKSGQSMPVTDGSPYIYLEKCTWGGLE